MKFEWVRGGNADGKPGYFLSFEYNPDVIEKIKKTIPPSQREWNPETKRWWISELCEKQVNDIFKGFLEAVVAQRRLF